jgi:polysaccharide pyruvyl transferase WcaK-like protein
MTDYLLQAWVSANIERAKAAWILGKGERWQPGKKLKLLFAGYNGSRNTGSDVRPEETLRQLRHILGAENVEFSVMSQNFDLTRHYFAGARQVHLPDVFPPFLSREVPKHHGVIVVEGSAFKSKFANALTTMIIGSLGTATAQNKLAVGYGSEAGYMDPSVAKMCARYCKDSLIITRNEESRTVLRKLGVPTELGTDTAWTFEPLPPEYGRKVLTDAGWDGRLPVLMVCPINPFWWPVKPSLFKYAAHTLTSAYKDSHYRTLYFHKDGAEVEAAFETYLTAIANAVRAFRERHRVFVALVAAEQLDARACHRIAEKLGAVPVFSSENHDMFQMVSILRAAQLMVSSRFHGIVTSMPAFVPSAGITMDERIRNLMRDRGQEELLMNVDDPDLEARLLAALEILRKDGERIADGIGRTVVKNLKTMARMGVYFEEELRRRYPEFPTRKGEWSWEDYLPPLDAGLRRLIASYSDRVTASA